MIITKALFKQFFGSKNQSLKKSLLSAVILFIAISASEFQLEITSSILYLTSTFFTAGIMWQMLTGRPHIEAMQGMFMLPFSNHNFVFSYVITLGVDTLVTKTMPVWALFFAVTPWRPEEIIIAIFCGCMSCVVTAAEYRMCRMGNKMPLLFWNIGILAVILSVKQEVLIFIVIAASFLIAVLYLTIADAYDFCPVFVSKRTVLHKEHIGSVIIYFMRYLLANKNHLINTVGLCAIACFLPMLFRKLQGLNMFPIGLAILCMNTPICTLLSGDPDLNQAIRVLPGQSGRFYRGYCLFLFIVNGIIAAVYLCSWQIIYGKIRLVYIETVFLFVLQSSILSVILEWKYPIRGWKTESDLWHHPRKYLVPLIMLLIANLVSIYIPFL